MLFLLTLASLVWCGSALYQPMRVTERLFELGEIGDETLTNPVFTSQATPVYAQLHGGVYSIINPALPPVNTPADPPYRTGDRVPEDLNYYTLDTAEYPTLLEKLRVEANATVVKLWVRGRSTQDEFQFVSDADAHAFCATALGLGLKVILGYWWDTSLVSSAVSRQRMVLDMWSFVDEFKHDQAVVAWAAGQVKEPTPVHANDDAIRGFFRELVAIAAQREHHVGVNANSETPIYCYPRRPVTFTMGLNEIWGQLRWQPAVAAVPEQYMNFPDSPAVPAIPAACYLDEWTSEVTLAHTVFSVYEPTAVGYARGVHTRQRMRHVNWGEPVLTNTHTCVPTGSATAPSDQLCP